jgi:hypothetical protein
MYHSFVAPLGLEVRAAPRSEVYMERVEPARTEGMGRTSPDLLHASTPRRSAGGGRD